ncbi:MAG: ABC transporter ATP-binding protein [Patescibacteria group bacterium]
MRIELINISKKFNLNFVKSKSALEIFTKRKIKKDDFWALKDISFQAEAGENIGIIGKNGSGKSTLLRVIAGIYIPDKGLLKTNGEIVYLTGFGQGLSSKLTMKENIYLTGSIMGLSQKDIKKRFNEIVDFSELEKYINIKLYKFSSGMISRLGSSIGIFCLFHKNPDILLLDEVLGVGADIDYQNKALKKIEELIKGGSTVILASHDLDSIKKYCHRTIWLDKGNIIKIGEPNKIVLEYTKDS